MMQEATVKDNNTGDFEVIIIGSGFSGLLAAIKLNKKGFDDFILLERSSEIGGTWRDNSYPGAEVDVPTGLYSISFIPYRFTKRYAPQNELLEYTNHIVNKYNLREKIHTNQSVCQLRYQEDSHHWHIETTSGNQYSARFVIDTSGVLANPHLPAIKGAESFKGPSFHTAQWNHNVSYEGKKVAVIGSGCSAVQVVPAIASKVERLTLFMGKAQWIIPKFDRKYSQIEQYLMNLPVIRHINRFLIFSYHEMRFVAFRRYKLTQIISKPLKYIYANILKRNLKKYIKDDQLRKHMMPDYEMGCRRVIPTNKYLPALACENVSVDISGIDHITPSGIKTKDGKDIPLDLIIYATGFYAYSNMKKALTFQVFGLNGRNLNTEWESEAVSYKGITVSGYPNYFKVNGPNTVSGHSSQISYMQAMVTYSIKAIAAIKKDQSIKAIDVKLDVQNSYVSKLRKNLKQTVWQTGGCESYYKKNMTGIVTNLSPESLVSFILKRNWFNFKDYRILK